MQGIAAVNLGGEVGCMISEGPWVFVGMPNFVKVRWPHVGIRFSFSHIVSENF